MYTLPYVVMQINYFLITVEKEIKIKKYPQKMQMSLYPEVKIEAKEKGILKEKNCLRNKNSHILSNIITVDICTPDHQRNKKDLKTQRENKIVIYIELRIK